MNGPALAIPHSTGTAVEASRVLCAFVAIEASANSTGQYSL
jgi:hypothetical protein